MLRNPLVLIILMLSVSILVVGCSSPSEPTDLTYGSNSQPDDDDNDNDPIQPVVTTGVDVGNEAPEFTLADTYGDNVVLSELRGKPVLLFFWATGCVYCEEQYPRIQGFHDSYADSLTVLSINLGDDPQLINAFMADRDLTFPCLVGTTAMQTAYEVTGVPHALVLDVEGLVTFNNHPGYLTEANLMEEF